MSIKNVNKINYCAYAALRALDIMEAGRLVRMTDGPDPPVLCKKGEKHESDLSVCGSVEEGRLGALRSGDPDAESEPAGGGRGGI